MVTAKRLTIATVSGLLFGLLSWLGARYGASAPVPWSGALTIILDRTVLGFAIGISGWTISWWLHGLLLGLVFSLPQACGTKKVPCGIINKKWVTIKDPAVVVIESTKF